MADFVIVRNEKGQEKRISTQTWALMGNNSNRGNTRKGWTVVGNVAGKASTQAPPTKAATAAATFIPDEIREANERAQLADKKKEAEMISAEPSAPKGDPAAVEAPAAPVQQEAAAVVDEPAKEQPEAVEAPAPAKDKFGAIEGITAKVEKLLNDAGILTFKDLANAPMTKITKALDEAGLAPKKALVPSWKTKAAEHAKK